MRRCFLIGLLQDGARKAALLENNNLVSHYYDQAKTMYEVFQRGLKVSGDEAFQLVLDFVRSPAELENEATCPTCR